VGDLEIPPQLQFQITKHLNLVDLAQGAIFFCRCSEFEVWKVDQDPQHVGDLLILDPHHQKEAPTGVVGGLKWYSWGPQLL
jgi:hypothetical protein